MKIYFIVTTSLFDEYIIDENQKINKLKQIILNTKNNIIDENKKINKLKQIILNAKNNIIYKNTINKLKEHQLNCKNRHIIRKNQYINGINKLKQIILDLQIKNYKIIIVENSGLTNTFLDTFKSPDCEILYTDNNLLKTNNKGIKELKDVFNCIKKINIKDEDFIVKMTGRYLLNNDSKFMNIVKDISSTNYDCIIRYGTFGNPAVNYKIDNCITGLIGMRCFYVKQIKMPDEDECVEWNWAKTANLINDEKVYLLDELGINICPGTISNYYLA
jgi:hypothetical protein